MSRDELAVALEDLAGAIRALEETIEDTFDDESQTRSRGLPSLEDVLRVTDERAIPALIGLLEAQIRALTLLRRGSRAVRRGRDVNQRVRGVTRGAPDFDRNAATIVDRMGETLDEIQRRLGDSTDAETRELLDRTRATYEEIERRLTDRTTGGRSAGYRIEIDDGSSSTDSNETGERRNGDRPDDRATTSAGDHVDVDAELQTLRDRYGTDTDADESNEAETDESSGRDEPAQTDDDSDDTDADDSTGMDAGDSNGIDAGDSDDRNTGDSNGIDADDPDDTDADDSNGVDAGESSRTDARSSDSGNEDAPEDDSNGGS